MLSTEGPALSPVVMLCLLLPLLFYSPLPGPHVVQANPDAKRLYDEILSGYNKLVRPVKNVTDPVTVKVKLKLSQLIDVVSLSDDKYYPRLGTLLARLSLVGMTPQFSLPYCGNICVHLL